MASLGALTFDGGEGDLPSAATARVDPIENPAQVPAVVVVSGQPMIGRLRYAGFKTASVRAAVAALPGTHVDCTDGAGRTRHAMILSATCAEVAAVQAGTAGLWVEVEVEAWEWTP